VGRSSVAAAGEAGVRVTVVRRLVPPGVVDRRALLVAVVALALAAAGCGRDASADPGRTSQWPAGAAGAACQLLEYDRVETRLGAGFDTAGGAHREDTYTCALTRAGQEYPDLTLAMTATTADEVIFTATVVPSGSKVQKDLGLVAYRIQVPAAGRAGPAVEIGWLSAKGRLMVLRYTFAADATTAQIEEFTPKLIQLARDIERPAQPAP
jgi:hypothetical protein